MKKTAREIYSLLRGAHVGAMRNTQTYLVVAHDSSAGEMFLSDDRLRVSWPGAGKSALLSQSSERMSNASEALSGTYVKNPIWNQWTNQELISGHPLGGCIMAEDAKDGVVNHKGQVYSNTAGISVHDGLYVMDASIIPRSLGVNPLLTISALAERSCHHLALDHGWAIEYERNPSRAGQNSN
jgi:cholesterol oxidase